MKLSLIKKRLDEIKIGDLVYYSGFEIKRYCIVKKIEDNKVWGYWNNTILLAKKGGNGMTWAELHRCFNEIE